MSAQLKLEPRFSKEEYWNYERQTETKSEFYQGVIYAMAGTTPDHNRIAGDVFASIHGQLRGKRCEAFIGDQRIEVEKTTLQTYPDVLVACPPFAYDAGDNHTMTDCVVIVEVLSPSTANYDRKAKFDNYKQLPSLRQYLLIEQKQVAVTHHHKDVNEQWQSETLASLDDMVEIAAIDCSLEVREVYRRIRFDAS